MRVNFGHSLKANGPSRLLRLDRGFRDGTVASVIETDVEKRYFLAAVPRCFNNWSLSPFFSLRGHHFAMNDPADDLA